MKQHLSLLAIFLVGIASPALAQESTIEVDYFRYNTAGTESVGSPEPIASDPKAKALPKDFPFPIVTSVEQNTSITTNSPITDALGDDNLPAWEEAIRECMLQTPRLRHDQTGNTVRINGSEGTIVLNSNGVSVCPR
ncbi:MAG: hypothetical protein SWY16_12110 [Cyanobacteriota bacterium]|nr:hypothetical protein [Cyanobacteriota bacterium]